MFPRWVPFGCGGASAFILIILFFAGAFFNGGGSGSLFDFALGAIQKELDGQYASDVTPAEKASLDAEMTELRRNLRTNAVSPDRMLPLLRSIQSVIDDQKITRSEAQQLIKQLHEINATKKKR